MRFIIIDWMSNVCFGGISFDSFDDAEDWLTEKLGDDYETDRQEYYITDAPVREARYLDPKRIGLVTR